MSNDLMADLAEAWPDEEKTEETTHEEAETVTEAAPEEAAPSDAEKAPTEEVGEQETPPETEAAGKESTPPDDPAPHTASLALREAWKDLPQSVKDDYQAREARHSTELQKNAEGAKMAGAMMSAMQPYQGALQMEGNSPMAAIASLGQTVHGLRNGTPTEKAQIMANLVKRYGVDIMELDGALVAEPQQQQPQQQQQFRDPRVDHMLQQQNQQRTVDAQQNIQQFQQDAKAEFMSDPTLRNDMANFLDGATARGEHMPLQKAYDLACQMNPQVTEILAQRKMAENAQVAKDKANAASSVSGGPGGSGAKPPADDLRATLEYNWRES